MQARDRTTRVAAAGALALLAVMLSTTAGSASSRPEGVWQGSLQGMMRIVVHVERAPDGGLKGTMDSPDQGVMGLPIDTLLFANDSLRFTMRRIGGEFAGRLSADTLDGTWRQGGMGMALVLQRSEKVAERARPQEPAKPYPYAEDTVRVANRAAGLSLAGTLTAPRGTGPFACAVLITGSGPEDRDETVFGHRPFLVLADHLTRAGIAVLRMDDRGVGGSSGRMSRATSEDFASDVLAGIEFLKGRKEIDPRRIGLIGHSEGGLIAPMVAVRSKDVAFIVLMAGPGVRGDSLLIMQTAAMRRLQGMSEDVIAREADLMWKVHAQVRAGDSVGVVRATRDLVEAQVAMTPADQRKRLGDLDSVAVGASRQMLLPWMRFFDSHDPRGTLMKVRCPVLALGGSKDFQVPSKENLAAIRASLAAGGNRDAMVKELPGLNHLFQTATTGSLTEYATIEETIAPAALEEMSRWIVAHTTATR